MSPPMDGAVGLTLPTAESGGGDSGDDDDGDTIVQAR